jgi:hypothetical protein
MLPGVMEHELAAEPISEYAAPKKVSAAHAMEQAKPFPNCRAAHFSSLRMLGRFILCIFLSGQMTR